MSPITTHVLDTRLGAPAAGMFVSLETFDSHGSRKTLAVGRTNPDGRILDLLAPGALTASHYRLEFRTGEYFIRQQVEHFYTRVIIEFTITAVDQHYHVPLLLSPFGYSTYRGS